MPDKADLPAVLRVLDVSLHRLPDCQGVDAVCRGDEAIVRATTRGGNLPVAK